MFRDPIEAEVGDEVRVRLRTARDNVDQVVLMQGDVAKPTKVVEHDELFDYYEGVITLKEEKAEYYFLLTCAGSNYYYNRIGLTEYLRSEYNFVITPGFHTPKWARGAIFYQIFVDRFLTEMHPMMS